MKMNLAYKYTIANRVAHILKWTVVLYAATLLAFCAIRYVSTEVPARVVTTTAPHAEFDAVAEHTMALQRDSSWTRGW